MLPVSTLSSPDEHYVPAAGSLEWDEVKAGTNVEKHGITFEEAAQAFFDPFHQGGEASVDGERRDFIPSATPWPSACCSWYTWSVRAQCASSPPVWPHVPKGGSTSTSDEPTELHLRPRAAENVTVSIPVDTLAAIREVAGTRDMTVEALKKLYIGSGLWQDASRLFSERIMETTARVLARHIHSEEDRSAILREIQGEAAA